MAEKIPPFVRPSLDFAMNRALVSQGCQDSLIPGGFSALVDTLPNVQNGTTYSMVASDYVIFMNQDAVRTLTLLGGSPAGTQVMVVDNSLSATAGHTLTVHPSSGKLWKAGAELASDNLVITPGTNNSALIVCDGTNWFVVSVA